MKGGWVLYVINNQKCLINLTLIDLISIYYAIEYTIEIKRNEIALIEKKPILTISCPIFNNIIKKFIKL